MNTIHDYEKARALVHEYPQQQIVVCRKCGHGHYGTQCDVCKEPTPHLAVIRPFVPHFKTIE